MKRKTIKKIWKKRRKIRIEKSIDTYGFKLPKKYFRLDDKISKITGQMRELERKRDMYRILREETFQKARKEWADQ